jgi:hypothetical protein
MRQLAAYGGLVLVDFDVGRGDRRKPEDILVVDRDIRHPEVVAKLILLCRI